MEVVVVEAEDVVDTIRVVVVGEATKVTTTTTKAMAIMTTADTTTRDGVTTTKEDMTTRVATVVDTDLVDMEEGSRAAINRNAGVEDTDIIHTAARQRNNYNSTRYLLRK